ncbi:MAG: 4-amino-4-deoxy-L-arabinose transferase-like glycosyltransferase/TolA-binding protein [Candidatus Latescibacterota bacterium]|jgi:4-amino-4-deoxy-L-arabinose transferase-like glycosyltransferase/TolA-binding protein
MRVDLPPNKHLLKIVLCCAVGLRLLYVYMAQGTPLSEVLLIDSDFYHRDALRIASGDWWGSHVFFMNPFYPYFLALIYAIGGEYTWLVGIVQAVMGTVSCYWVYAIGVRIWGEWEGLIAAALMAFYGVLIFYDGSLLTASPILFFNLAALVALLNWERAGDTRWLYAGGVLLGLSATARPMILLFALLVLIWSHNRELGKIWPNGVRIWLGIALVLVPVAARNYIVGGEWVLTTSAAGMNFYVGNHPDATGIYAQANFLSSAEPDNEREEFIREAQRRSGRELSPAQTSRFWLDQGLSFILSEPLAYVSLLARKLYMFANRVEAQNNLSYYFARDFIPLLHGMLIGWWLLAPVAVGAWVFARKSRRCLLLDLYFASYLLACLVFFVSSEYRLPLVPVLALYSGSFVVDCLNWSRRDGSKILAQRIALITLLAIPVNYADALAQRLTLRRVDYYNFGVLYERRDNRVRAEQMFRGSLVIDSEFAPARAGLARVLTTHSEGGGRTDTLVTGALKAYAEGQYSVAQRLLAQAIARGAAGPQLYNNLGLVYYKTGSMKEAKRAFSQAISLAPDYAKAQYNLGLVQVAIGDFPGADSSYARALKIEPEYRQALYKRGQLAAQLGHADAAFLYWNQLMPLSGGDEKLKAQIDSLLRVR